MHVTVKVMPPLRPPNSYLVKLPQQQRPSDSVVSFTIPAEPTDSFEQLWVSVEQRYVKAYGDAHTRDCYIAKLQTITGADIAVADEIGTMFNENAPQKENVLVVIRNALDLECSIPDGSILRPTDFRKPTLDSKQQKAIERLRKQDTSTRAGLAAEDDNSQQGSSTAASKRKRIADNSTGTHQSDKPAKRPRRHRKAATAHPAQLVLVPNSQTQQEPSQRSMVTSPKTTGTTAPSFAHGAVSSTSVRGSVLLRTPFPTPIAVQASNTAAAAKLPAPPTPVSSLRISSNEPPESAQRPKATPADGPEATLQGEEIPLPTFASAATQEEDPIDDGEWVLQNSSQFDDDLSSLQGDNEASAGPTSAQQQSRPPTRAHPNTTPQTSINVFEVLRSSQPTRSAQVSGPWSKEEDRMLLEGVRKGWTTDAILSHYNIDRTNSAARSRKKVLIARYPEKVLPQSAHSVTTPRARNLWTSDELNALETGYHAGLLDHEIYRLSFSGRSEDSVAAKIREIEGELEKNVQFPNDGVALDGWSIRDSLKLRRVYDSGMGAENAHRALFSRFPFLLFQQKFAAHARIANTFPVFGNSVLRSSQISPSTPALGAAHGDEASGSSLVPAQTPTAVGRGQDHSPQHIINSSPPDVSFGSNPAERQVAGAETPVTRARNVQDTQVQSSALELEAASSVEVEQTEQQAARAQLSRAAASGTQTRLNFPRNKRKGVGGPPLDYAEIDRQYTRTGLPRSTRSLPVPTVELGDTREVPSSTGGTENAVQTTNNDDEEEQRDGIVVKHEAIDSSQPLQSPGPQIVHAAPTVEAAQDQERAPDEQHIMPADVPPQVKEVIESPEIARDAHLAQITPQTRRSQRGANHSQPTSTPTNPPRRPGRLPPVSRPGSYSSRLALLRRHESEARTAARAANAANATSRAANGSSAVDPAREPTPPEKINEVQAPATAIDNIQLIQPELAVVPSPVSDNGNVDEAVKDATSAPNTPSLHGPVDQSVAVVNSNAVVHNPSAIPGVTPAASHHTSSLASGDESSGDESDVGPSSRRKKRRRGAYDKTLKMLWAEATDEVRDGGNKVAVERVFMKKKSSQTFLQSVMTSDNPLRIANKKERAHYKARCRREDGIPPTAKHIRRVTFDGRVLKHDEEAADEEIERYETNSDYNSTDINNSEPEDDANKPLRSDVVSEAEEVDHDRHFSEVEDDEDLEKQSQDPVAQSALPGIEEVQPEPPVESNKNEDSATTKEPVSDLAHVSQTPPGSRQSSVSSKPVEAEEADETVEPSDGASQGGQSQEIERAKGESTQDVLDRLVQDVIDAIGPTPSEPHASDTSSRPAANQSRRRPRPSGPVRLTMDTATTSWEYRERVERKRRLEEEEQSNARKLIKVNDDRANTQISAEWEQSQHNHDTRDATPSTPALSGASLSHVTDTAVPPPPIPASEASQPAILASLPEDTPDQEPHDFSSALPEARTTATPEQQPATTSQRDRQLMPPPTMRPQRRDDRRGSSTSQTPPNSDSSGGRSRAAVRQQRRRQRARQRSSSSNGQRSSPAAGLSSATNGTPTRSASSGSATQQTRAPQETSATQQTDTRQHSSTSPRPSAPPTPARFTEFRGRHFEFHSPIAPAAQRAAVNRLPFATDDEDSESVRSASVSVIGRARM